MTSSCSSCRTRRALRRRTHRRVRPGRRRRRQDERLAARRPCGKLPDLGKGVRGVRGRNRSVGRPFGAQRRRRCSAVPGVAHRRRQRERRADGRTVVAHRGRPHHKVRLRCRSRRGCGGRRGCRSWSRWRGRTPTTTRHRHDKTQTNSDVFQYQANSIDSSRHTLSIVIRTCSPSHVGCIDRDAALDRCHRRAAASRNGSDDRRYPPTAHRINSGSWSSS